MLEELKCYINTLGFGFGINLQAYEETLFIGLNWELY